MGNTLYKVSGTTNLEMKDNNELTKFIENIFKNDKTLKKKSLLYRQYRSIYKITC